MPDHDLVHGGRSARRIGRGRCGLRLMVAAARSALTAAVLCCVGATGSVAVGQVNGERAGDQSASVDLEDEIVVSGRSPGELRFELERAEQAVFDRFNAINSDDRFDVVCRSEPVIGSRIGRRICRSNAWREQEARFAEATVQQLQGQMVVPPQQYLGEQERMQRLLAEEMRRLAYADEELFDAMQRLASAQRAMDEYAGIERRVSASRRVIPGEDGLPYGAERMFEVEMGRRRWDHRLTQRTFEIAHVLGQIRQVEVQCDQGRERHRYDGEFAWTLPPGWSGCTLSVDARRDTTFVLYEFE